MNISAALKRTGILLLLAGVIFLQVGYDRAKPQGQEAEAPQLSLPMVKAFDLGLDSAAAGFYWVNQVIFELPTLKYGFDKFTEDLAFVNALDPRFSFPYYWTVLLLPDTNYPDAANAAIAIGTRGVQQADPDWRVSFFLATTYYLDKNDWTNAAKYFNLAAQDPGAPFYIVRFSENFGIAPNVRERTKEVWQAIAQSSDDPVTKARAEAYVARLDMFDFLEQAVRVYKQQYGKFPAKIGDLVSGGILTALPQDPFGFQFQIYQDGTVGIVK
ncbi:MAG TPA: hypothetical protein VNG29_00735 [Candidatus Paceibacterota bacterium]|nr:hypothetical protein [Candidatus Paceibacterota bacterium]